MKGVYEKNITRKENMILDMEEYFLACYEEGSLTKGDLRAALLKKGLARDIWVEFCDSEDFIEDCQSQIEKFLEIIDEVDV